MQYISLCLPNSPNKILYSATRIVAIKRIFHTLGSKNAFAYGKTNTETTRIDFEDIESANWFREERYELGGEERGVIDREDS